MTLGADHGIIVTQTLTKSYFEHRPQWTGFHMFSTHRRFVAVVHLQLCTCTYLRVVCVVVHGAMNHRYVSMDTL